MNCEEWQNLGTFTTVLTYNIFVIDKGKSTTTLAILHGFPTASFDFYKVINQLSEHYRVVIHDHLGFGFSEKPNVDLYRLNTQADIAEKLWSQLNVGDLIILAHDYGTSVATELLARNNKKKLKVNLKGMVLCNGSIHIELAKLKYIQKLLKSKFFGSIVAKFASQNSFKRTMKSIFYDGSKLSQEEIETMWLLITNNDGKRVLPKIAHYIDERYTFWNRWIGALKETNLTIGLVWASEDPIAVSAIAQQLASEIKNSRLFWLNNTGHYPMLENPNLWCDLVFKALDSIENQPLE